MIEDPELEALAAPLLLMVATDVLPDCHVVDDVTFWTVESVIVAFAVKVWCAPFGSETEVGEIERDLATAAVTAPLDEPEI